MAYIEVKHPTTGKRLFDYDPERQLVRIVIRRRETVVDLTKYQLRRLGEQRPAGE